MSVTKIVVGRDFGGDVGCDRSVVLVVELGREVTFVA